VRKSLFAAGVLAVALSTPAVARADPSSTTPEQGYGLGQVESPRAMAMGDANNALGVSTGALYLNPANMALARVYHFEGLATYSPEARRQSYGGAVVDSVLNTQHLAGGLALDWSMMDPDGIHRQWTDVRVGLGYPMGDHLAIGVIGRYLQIDQSVAGGPFGPSFVSDGTRDSSMLKLLTFDAGATVLFTNEIRLGVVGHNLTGPGTGLAPTTLAGGLGYMGEIFALEGGGLVDFTTWSGARVRAMAGGELFVADRYAIRLGYRYDDGTRTHALTGGLGYIDKKWSAELGVRRDIAGQYPATFFTLSLRYFYNAVTVAADQSSGGDF
jgi:hypothetical protein